MAQPVSKVIRGLVIAGAVSFVLLLTGIGFGRACARCSAGSVLSYGPWVQLLSGALFLWAVLALLGWEIQTWKGQTPAEELNKWAFRVLNCIGMFLLFASSAALIFIKG